MRTSFIIKAALATFTLGSTAWAQSAHAESDAWLTTKAKMALWTAGGVRSGDVHVDTINGIVTLFGKVTSEAEKTKADEAVRQINGVSNVRDLLQVVPKSEAKEVASSDKEVKEHVEKILSGDRALKGSHIRVKSVNDGVVLLTGKADTLLDHLIAIEDADAISGVKRVATEVQAPNEIGSEEVVMVYAPREAARKGSDHAKNESVGEKTQDMRITTAAKLRLLADSETPASQINVDTVRGHVTLFGLVETVEAKAAAEVDVKKVSGVKAVTNDLQIVPAARADAVKVTDDEIKSRVEKTLGAHNQYKGVSVDVKSGIVRLTGKVPSGWDRMHVAMLTRSTAGTRAVETDVEVKK